jgi:hypothetical protein
MPEPTPPMPQSQEEWETHWAFYKLTVAQRNLAWNELEQMRDLITAIAARFQQEIEERGG